MTSRDSLISFGGCDYLGLRCDPRVVAAAVDAVQRWGVGTGASRATSGEHPLHGALEKELAAFVGAEAAILLPSGGLANLALAEALLPPDATIFVDSRSHPSVSSAARLGAGSLVDDPADATVIFTDGVFPARGEIADLPSLLELLPGDGWLIVDDCHGLGVTGPGGRGTVAAHGIDDARVIHTVTLAKSLGSAGGAVVGSASVVERVAATDLHVGSTALPPAWAAAAREGVRILRDEPERHAALVDAVGWARELLPAAGVPLPREPLPVFRVDGSADELRELSAGLAADGFDVPHIRYPDGPPEGYLRIMVSARRSRVEVGAFGTSLGRRLRD